MKFTLTGRFKPYVRMTQRSKYVDPQAQQYLASKVEMGLQLRQQMAANGWDMLPRRTPLAVNIVVLASKVRHNCDIDNIAKGTIDSAQGIVFLDDRWIDYLRIRRVVGPEDQILLSVELYD